MVFIAAVAGLIWSATIGFEAGQASPDTKNIFTSIAEKNTNSSQKKSAPKGAFLLRTMARTNGQSCSWRPLLVSVAGYGGLVLTRTAPASLDRV